jgi:hypothetical protein
MPIHPKTLAIYEKAGFPYHFDVDDKAYKNWLAQVQDLSGEFNAEIQEVVQSIYRIKSSDNKEYLAWDGSHVGIDGLKNPLSYFMSSKGHQLTWVEPKLRIAQFHDSKTNSIKSRATEEISRTTRYEQEFNAQAAEELLKKANPATVNLVVYRDYQPGLGGKSSPFTVDSWDKFINGDFDDLCRLRTNNNNSGGGGGNNNSSDNNNNPTTNNTNKRQSTIK